MDPERGLHFNHVAMALDAASDGQGVVLQPRPGVRHVELFRNWLLEDAKSQQERIAAAETAPA